VTLSGPIVQHMFVRNAHANHLPSSLDPCRVRIERDLQDTVSLVAEEIEGFLDLIESDRA